MSVIVRDENDQILLLCKGADRYRFVSRKPISGVWMKLLICDYLIVHFLDYYLQALFFLAFKAFV